VVFLLPPIALAEVSECYDHYNHEAWGGDGLAIVLCRNSPDLDSCEIRRHAAERLQGLNKHGSLDDGRQVFADYNTTGAAFPFAIDIVCNNSQVTLTYELPNGNAWADGCCRNQEYGPADCCDVGGDPPCEDPDYQDPPVGTPGGPACPELRSREYSGGERLLDVQVCSETRLTFHIDQVPDPADLTWAELTMELHDSDHPNEEGTVWINDNGPLQLPARAEWDDQTAPATIPLPLNYLVAGTNTIEFGAGPRTRTYYSVNLLALTAEGPACQTDPEPDPGGDDAGSSGDAPHDGAAQDADAGAGDDAQIGDDAQTADDAGVETDEDTGEGDGCSCGSNSLASGWGLLMLLSLCLISFARRSASSGKKHGFFRLSLW
jgi:hypothetical protein